MSGFWARKVASALLIIISSPCGAIATELPSDPIAYWRSEMLNNLDRLQFIGSDTKHFNERELANHKVDASLCWHDSITAYILVNKKLPGIVEFAFNACKDLFAPVVESWNLQGVERADTFNRWMWPLTGSALLSLKLAKDIPDTWNNLKSGIRPSEAYRLSPEDQRKYDEIKRAELKLRQCVEKLPRPEKGTWFMVSSVLRSYVMACNAELITLMSGAENSKNLGLASSISVAADAANCRYSTTDEQLPEGERLIVCLP